jgi:hypothetical protein
MIIQPIGILENCLINSPKSMRLLVSHSAAGEEPPVIVSFLLKHINMRSFTALQDNKEQPNGVILSVSEESHFFLFLKEDILRFTASG